MRKAFLALTIIILISAFGFANATQVRSSSLGPAAEFTTDDMDVWVYPAELQNYPNMLSIDLDTFLLKKDNLTFVGAWSDGEQKLGTFGAGFGDLFNQKNIESLIPALNAAIANNPLMSPRNLIPQPVNIFHFFYAKDIGPVVTGLHLSRASGDNSYDFSDTIPEDAVKRQAGIGLWSLETGISTIIGDNIYLQSCFGYQAISFSARFELSGADPLYWEEVADKDANGVRLDLRLFYGLTNKLKIVPVISYKTLSFGYSASYADTAHMPGSLYNGTGSSYFRGDFKGALGAEYRPGRDIKLMGGISLEYNVEDIADSNNIWLVTVNPARRYLCQNKTSVVFPGFQAGVETGLLRWLKLRLGASQRPERIKTKSEYGNSSIAEISENTSVFNIYFGLGFDFGRFTIDVQLNKDQPYNIGYLVSGNPNEPFTRLSLKYSY